MATLPNYAPPFSQCFLSPRTQEDIERDEQIYNSYEKLTSQLPILHDWPPFNPQQYQSFWIPAKFLPACMAIQSHFNPRSSDILCVGSPKTGSTWLKALSFAVLHRHSFSLSDHPLLTNNPHKCVPFLELLFSHRTIPDLNVLPSPTIFATHLTASLLPQSALSCRIVYVCRDPKDTFVSLWHFTERLRVSLSTEDKSERLDLNKAFQLFSQGISPGGSFWDHALGYWKESKRRPEKVLFLKYEEMIEDPVIHLRKLAEFMGCPFSMEEERDGVVEDIVKLCSFDNLTELEVNKDNNGSFEETRLPASSFFRKGKVGDWVNYLSMEMAEKLDAITKEKLHGSGLSFS
ncbi:P-loop containing nucleoside triphosphate hydrolase protein [Dioscorea alata]|uniref:P-loop containing nucleoside triphosphate hydrolase protein n=1 Tax=Dioscorea alata TaxID=55571 RepID=A0ACB7V0N4_DIOAL|nr:P-loop containing nucleoside triphosphate hydrolase protein [Dioscorea alata]